MTQNGVKHVSIYENAPKIFGLKFKITSRVILYFEAILGKFMLILSICTIIYSPNWYPVFINFLFLFYLIFAIICYNLCLSRRSSIFAFPLLSYEVVTIFWLSIWLYAALNAVASGFLWSLEWLGGPTTSRKPYSRDIKEVNYANPNETHPEVTKAIKYGAIIAAVCIVLIILKFFVFIVSRRTFMVIRKMEIEESEDKAKAATCETESEISNIGGTSPPYPIAFRNRPTKKMEPVHEVQVEEYTPQPSPAPRRIIKKSSEQQNEIQMQCQYSPLSKYEETSF